jgi:hypothetical protein
MGPYMALIVPSSFHRIDAGLHALSFSMIVSKYFVGGGLLNINLFITSTLKINIFTLLIVYTIPLCIYTQSLYIA